MPTLVTLYITPHRQHNKKQHSTTLQHNTKQYNTTQHNTKIGKKPVPHHTKIAGSKAGKSSHNKSSTAQHLHCTAAQHQQTTCTNTSGITSEGKGIHCTLPQNTTAKHKTAQHNTMQQKERPVPHRSSTTRHNTKISQHHTPKEHVTMQPTPHHHNDTTLSQ